MTEAPTTDTKRYEAAIREAIEGDAYPPETAGSPHSLARAVTAAIRPLVAAEVAAARADERESIAREIEAEPVPDVESPWYTGYRKGLVDAVHVIRGTDV